MLDNYAIADQFSLLSKLMEIHGENSFKAKSYSTSAFNIEKLPVQLSETPREKIASLKGIGDSSARKIVELLDTGHLSALDDMIAKTPAGILEMMQIKGIGPKKIATIWKEMGIESLGELLYACNENRLLLYKGFGEKTQESVRQAIQYYQAHKGQFLYADIEAFALELEKKFQEQFAAHKNSLTGAIKRQSIVITQVDLLTTANLPDISNFLQDLNFEIKEQDTATTALPNAVYATAPTGATVLIISTTPENFIPELIQQSSSPQFLEALKKETNFPNTNATNSNATPFDSEEAFFQALQLPFIPANQRELPELLQKAKEGSIEPLITVNDIKGIIHSHSTWSDGAVSLEAMAKACIEKGFEYLVISDHSKSAFYANGLSVDRIKEQHEQIEELNSQLAPFRIFKSIEADILSDGSLDYDDATLNQFDLVIASVHSNLKMTEEKAMDRLLKAIQHPATRILGHMTGRLLLSRPGYPINHNAIIDACAANNVVIEINAHPRRLDLDWSWITYAIEKGCLLSIDPDAHTIEGFDDIRYGVLAAQKGLLTPAHNLSSYNLEKFTQWMMEKQHKI